MIIRNVSCSFLLHIKMKNIKGNIQPNEVSVVNTELSLKVKRVMLMIFSIDLVQYETSTFILKCFLQFTCTNLDGSQKEGGNFLNLLQKEGGTQKGGFPQKRGVSNPGGNYAAACHICFLGQMIRICKHSVCDFTKGAPPRIFSKEISKMFGASKFRKISGISAADYF